MATARRKKRKLPKFLSQCDLPSARAHDGSPVAAEMILEAFMNVPRAGAEAEVALREVDRATLVELTSAIVRAWMDAGAPRKETWLLHAAAELADDESIRRSIALGEKWVRANVSDELADRFVPTFGLDAQGSTWLDYGPRRFRVGFDAELHPYVFSESGERLRSLPRASKTDDAPKVERAKETLKALKVDVKTVARDVLRRMERMMIGSRTVTTHEFARDYLEHPLVRHVARAFVWGAVDARFRIAEDGTFADARDDSFSLDPSTRVGLVHPLLLDEAERNRWRTIFHDYAIVQPFAQLGRELYPPTKEEARTSLTRRFAGRVARGERFFALRYRGWNIGEHEVEKTLDDGAHASLEIEPGIDVLVYTPEDQTLGALTLEHADRKATFGDLDPIAASELFRDVESLSR